MITTKDVDSAGLCYKKPIYYLEIAVLLCLLNHYAGKGRPDLSVRIGGDRVNIAMRGVTPELKEAELKELERGAKECFMLRHWEMTVDLEVKE
jgi:hypothetical protein